MDRGLQSLVIVSTLTAIAGSFVVVRCIARFAIIKKSGIEDYLLLVALAFSIGLTAIVGLQRQNGLGKHIGDVSEEEGLTLGKLLYSSVPIYNLALLCVKTSLLFQYLRFFVDERYRRTTWMFIVLNICAGSAFIPTAFFTCMPVARFWDTIIPGKCINRLAFWYCFSAFHLVTDFATWALPVPVLVKLDMPTKQKLSLIFAFVLGGFGCIVSILRLPALYYVSISNDITYDNVAAVTWSSVEVNVGLTCACLPALRPILALLAPSLFGNSAVISNNRHTHRHNSSITIGKPYNPSGSYFQRDDNIKLIQDDAKTLVTKTSTDEVFDMKSMANPMSVEDVHMSRQRSVDQSSTSRSKLPRQYSRTVSIRKGDNLV